ncbi:MAG: S41 family peptidase [Bacillota bacterium]|nr:S41 family peptidase [Bacillota bacterium]
MGFFSFLLLPYFLFALSFSAQDMSLPEGPALSQEQLLECPVGRGTLQCDALLEEHIASLYDDYAYYYTKEEFDVLLEDYEGSFGGIGVSMINNVDGNIEVYSVLEDGPAKETEISVGDIVLSADGHSLLGYDVSLGVRKVRGEIGTTVVLELRHPDGEEYTVSIVREEIIADSVEGELFEEHPNTGYIYIYDFNEQTPREFLEVYSELRESRVLRTLILDLRSNGGGALDAAMYIANFFLPPGKVILKEKTIQGMAEYESMEGQLEEVELVILVNEYTASASEVLAAALKEQAGAVLIGSTTFGKGITQALATLPSGAGLRYTRSHYYTPNDYDLHEVGYPVDVEVPLSDDLTREEYWSTDPDLNPCLKAVVDYFAAK